MARSFIDPSLVAQAAQPVAPPWNWNPGATFVEAYNEAQRTKIAREKAELDNWMNETLFPLKQQKAEMSLEKLVAERDRLMLNNEIIRKNDRQRYRLGTKIGQDILNSGVGDKQPTKDPTSFDLSGTTYDPSVRKTVSLEGI